MSFCLFAKGAVSDFWKWIGQSSTTHLSPNSSRGSIHSLWERRV